MPPQPATPSALVEFMSAHWAPRAVEVDGPAPGAAYAARRRAAVSERFPEDWLVVPAGTPKVRANDTDYRFRAATGLRLADCDHGARAGRRPRDRPRRCVDPVRRATGGPLDAGVLHRPALRRAVGGSAVRRGRDGSTARHRHGPAGRVGGDVERDGGRSDACGPWLRRHRRRPGGRVRGGRRRAAFRPVGAPPGQGRPRGGVPLGRHRLDRPRIRGRGAGASGRHGVLRALGGGHVQPPGPHRGQRRRVRHHRRVRPPRVHAALDPQRRAGALGRPPAARRRGRGS